MIMFAEQDPDAQPEAELQPIVINTHYRVCILCGGFAMVELVLGLAAVPACERIACIGYAAKEALRIYTIEKKRRNR